MKKIALITLSTIVSLLIVSCRRELTLQEKAEKAVKRYLDTTYDGKAKVKGFRNFTTYKDYVEQYCREDYERLVKKYPKDSINEKKFYEKEAIDQQIGRQKWYKIECIYNSYYYGEVDANFYVDPQFKKVVKEHFAE